MNVVIAKTKAEQTLGQQFEAAAASLPGTDSVRKMRQQAFAAFSAAGLPHRRVEQWKYTDLRSAMKAAHALVASPAAEHEKAAVQAALGALGKLDATTFILVDGIYSARLSDRETGPGITAMPLRDALNQEMFAGMHGTPLAIEATHPMAALNSAFMRDGVALHLSASPARPIHIVHVATANEPRAIFTRNVVYVAENIEAVIVESHVCLGSAGQQSNALTHIGVGTSARVTHVKVTAETKDAQHVSTWLADVAADASYKAFQLTAGSALVRNDIVMTFKGEGAETDLSGVMLGRARDHIDTTLIADHALPGCTSRELFKAVLDDTARAVFQGKLIVRPDAQKTDAKQMAQALLLSEDAEFDSKPELEIYADDVACGHGATSGQIDEDLLFYLRSRGIPEGPARALLVTAFIGEALEKVENEDVRTALAAMAESWLARGDT